MLQNLLFQGIGSVGFFSSRAFMPAFVTALVLTYGPEMGFLGIDDSRFFENVEVAEIWFTSDFAVMLLGLLAIVEFVVMHNPDLRAMVMEFEVYVKPIMAIITFLGFFGAIEPESLVVAVRQAAVTDVLAAGAVGAGVFTVSSKRRDLMALFMEADEDDEVGIQKLFSWGEDLWVLFGPWFLLLFPLLTVFLIGIGIALLYRARKRAEAREEQSKIPCAACDVPIFRSALACPSCDTETESPRAVGYLGQAKANRAADPDTHPYRLVEKKRCPVCATRFKKRKPRQACTACGHALMADPGYVPAMTILGTIYQEHNQAQTALNLYRQAWALAPQSPGLELLMGEALMMLGQRDSARAVLSRVVQREPGNAQARTLLNRAGGAE